jgi:hypothetical protein
MVAQVAQATMSAHLFLAHCLNAVAAVVVLEAVQGRQVLAVHQLAALAVYRQAVRQQVQTRQAVAVAAVQSIRQQAATVVAELFMSGLRFNYGTFCKNRKQHSATSNRYQQ